MKKLIHLTSLLAFILGSTFLSAQNSTQSIHGTVKDAQSQSPIPGVTVVVLNSDPPNGVMTDVDGRYTINNVLIGHVSLVFTIMGYKPIAQGIILDIGKEGIINVSMEESVDSLNEVVVHARKDKGATLNEMTTVSARTFNPEDASRYAGSLGDPSRMATNFAGVGVADDSRNDIVIRGNSPLGLLWRLDGINIPNPNHFGTLGSTGGPVSILNNNLLDQSDFMTGAFPAEYGNALSGVFDLEMRSGNNEKSEFAGQVGFNGAELQAEGPLSKDAHSSYIVDARYSTLTLFHVLNINIGVAAVPQYEDLTFKLDFPQTKIGHISIFGLGGPSYIALLAKDQDKNSFNLAPLNVDTYFGSTMGSIGISDKYFFDDKTMQTITLSVSGLQNTTKLDTNYNGETKTTYGQNSTDMIFSISYSVNRKINAKNTVKIGATSDIYYSNYADSALHDSSFVYGTKFKGTNTLLQQFIEWQHKFTDNVVMNAGFHAQQFLLNNSTAFEPRFGIKWHFTEKQSISFATGLHSQIQPLQVYYYQALLSNNSYALTDKSLGFSKSAHFVLAYDNAFAPNWRIKVETYYQQLYNIPVQPYPSTYSALNIGASYYDQPYDSLVNKGTGRNYGTELTLERFFDKTYYLLVTGSLYEAKYTASDGVERNSAFNGNYTFNALWGADFNLDKQKRSILSFSVKANYAGGKRYIPVNLAASQYYHGPVYDYTQTYTNSYPPYERVDFKVSYKRNGKKTTQEWSFEVQNLFNNKNVLQQIYNPNTNSIETDYQLGFFPLGSYRITF
ncbi:MAG TPA: TonB-dependent receptor [Bacteroidia bacterium]|nr:TonB-dependent receptor [Bacteroidia bacterium]